MVIDDSEYFLRVLQEISNTIFYTFPPGLQMKKQLPE